MLHPSPRSFSGVIGELTESCQDADGKEIIDFICMLSATNLGQCHPKLLQAMTTSMQTSKYRPHEPRRFTLEVPQFDPVGACKLTASTTSHSHQHRHQVGDWAEFTRDMCARFGYDKMVGMVSGTEGADAAVKFARKWGIKRKGIPPRDVLVLGVSDNYHGVGSGIWPIMNDMGQASGKYIAFSVLTCSLTPALSLPTDQF